MARQVMPIKTFIGQNLAIARKLPSGPHQLDIGASLPILIREGSVPRARSRPAP